MYANHGMKRDMSQLLGGVCPRVQLPVAAVSSAEAPVMAVSAKLCRQCLAAWLRKKHMFEQKTERVA